MGLGTVGILRSRRTQAERSAETRQALIESAIRIIDRLGYGAATTAAIADDAGISRGAIIHQFGTRAEFMAEVIRWVFEQEVDAYRELMRELHIGRRVSDWVELTWRVLSRPSGVAVLEILLAAHSDPELAERIRPMQALNDERAQKTLFDLFSANDEDHLARIRLIHWAIRGLTIGQRVQGPEAGLEASVALFARWLRAAEDAGIAIGPRVVAPSPWSPPRKLLRPRCGAR